MASGSLDSGLCLRHVSLSVVLTERLERALGFPQMSRQKKKEKPKHVFLGKLRDDLKTR